ncbi:molybdopterin-guanine dinucleotide biosynthesis protein B [Varunaivibrio sulfuroxidans]|uniref:Molybdopterin guanine dinucleotide biosynthesis accessory protein MobB n=1 Tax=Varunaivibrio sulfuroxidans TaxID=1773489 RepID=A0A4R3J7K3_9PROT|nr:molybdopterin-guanine dinucleotide biosynthesis protein B [Varunaivibrio sulfuroxidans]TCS60883.1 molybdopterin guanine dinucleotide biosynthesis accessory protein MobB [Varunaivibrio sulfuroxidans]WES31708.1 molybdopterin-guanine dinucleotide biosynthesis protein B [Varunaivibrio sulfuroxidans]
MKVFGLVGRSGTGKTTLMIKLLDEVIARGYRVSTMKHTHHDFDLDQPGKDSFEHRRAGAEEVLLTSSRRWAVLHELKGSAEPDMDTLLTKMTPVDLVLVEGFKKHKYPKLEIHRRAIDNPLQCLDDAAIVAVASDEALPNAPVPVLDLNDFSAVADFILDHLGLKRSRQDRAS